MVKNNDASINLLCNHRFHHKCLIFLNNNTCPLCRRKLSGIPDVMERIIEERMKPKKKIKDMENEIKIHQNEHTRLTLFLQSIRLVMVSIGGQH